jgi:leucyl/phenylalanyl-tRNA--protein transferase
MPLHLLNDRLWFPPVEEAMDDGLLAIGGDISPERLLLAYQQGIFPWYNEDLPLWWSPDPRFVLFPDELRIHKSMRSIIQKNVFSFTVNQSFSEVLHHCSNSPRSQQDGTWLNRELIDSLIVLHQSGHAHSVEVWQDSKLIGGLYGIKVGRVFCGESMFSFVSNASKFGLIHYVHQLKSEGIQIIDCQVYSEHLASLGARMIERKKFMEYLMPLPYSE